jgi:hypothetical protein
MATSYTPRNTGDKLFALALPGLYSTSRFLGFGQKRRMYEGQMSLNPDAEDFSLTGQDYYDQLGLDTRVRKQVKEQQIKDPMSKEAANMLYREMALNPRGGGKLRNVAETASDLFSSLTGETRGDRSLETTYYKRFFGVQGGRVNVKEFMKKYGKDIEKRIGAFRKDQAKEAGISSADAALSSLTKTRKTKMKEQKQEEKQEQASLV